MKYISYLVITFIVVLMGWTADNSLNSIFVVHSQTKEVSVVHSAEITEKANISELLEIAVGN